MRRVRRDVITGYRKGLESFVDSPHAAIEGQAHGNIINLADHRAGRSRDGQLDLLTLLGPDKIVRGWALLQPFQLGSVAPLEEQMSLPHLFMPAHRDVREKDVNMRRLHGTLATAADRALEDFEHLLLTPGVRARTVQTLAMVAEVVHGCLAASPIPIFIGAWRQGPASISGSP